MVDDAVDPQGEELSRQMAADPEFVAATKQGIRDLEAGNYITLDELRAKLDPPRMPNEPTIEEVLEALYVDDCHISGDHDSTHTPHGLCSFQLKELAIRVLRTFGIDWQGLEDEELYQAINQIPRRIDRGEKGWSWFKYYQNDPERYQEVIASLEAWEREGVKSRE